MAHPAVGEEMAARFRRYPGAVAQTVTVAAECAFDLRLAKPRLPKLRRAGRAHPDAAGCGSWRPQGADELYPDNREQAGRATASGSWR